MDSAFNKFIRFQFFQLFREHARGNLGDACFQFGESKFSCAEQTDDGHLPSSGKAIHGVANGAQFASVLLNGLDGVVNFGCGFEFLND